MSLLNVNKIKPYNDGTSVTIEAADVFVSGTLEVSGTIKSYALETIVTSETTYLGSNKFGNDATDTHQFTGSIHGLIASSLEVKDSRLSLTDTDVVHGVTNVAATDVYGDFGPIHSTYGGLMINGLSDQENAGARSLALRGICNDTHTDTVSTVEIIGAKRSGATVQALDAAETVLQVANHSTTLMTVLGSGNVGIGTTTPAAKLDVDGSAIFNESGADVDFRVESDGNANMFFVDGGNDRIGIGTASPGASLEVKGGKFLLTDNDVAHGITNVAPTNAYGDFGPIHSTRGGLMINGLSDQESADARSLALRGVCNDTHTDTVATVEIIGAKRSGATVQALDASETVLQVANHSTTLMTVLGSGNVGIGDTSPDALLDLQGASATGAPTLLVDHDDADQIAVSVVAANTTANVVNINANSLTTGAAIYVTADLAEANAGSPFYGSLLKMESNSDDENQRTLASICNKHADAEAATLLNVINFSPSTVADVLVLNVADDTDSTTLQLMNMGRNAYGPKLEFVKNPYARAALGLSAGSMDDEDSIGTIGFTGKNTAGSPEDISYAEISVQANVVADGSEAGKMCFDIMNSGAGRGFFCLNGENGENEFNPDGRADIDFRVQSDNNANMLFVDASADGVGIGTASPGASLEVKDGKFLLTDNDVVHGITNVAPTNAYGDFGPIHSTRGGLMINGLSDQESADARSLALRGVCNDTHTDTVPTVEIIGAKRSGATIQAMAAAETVLQIANHSTALVNVLGSGAVLPGADNSYDLGSLAYRWANIYTGDLHLKNDRGDWTILEEEDYLCVVNNKSGKKYKMMLQEIDD